jgi:plastocyanin
MLGLSIDRTVIAIGFAALLAASGCSSHPAAAPSSASSNAAAASKAKAAAKVATVTVPVQSSGFQPASVRIAPGTNVVWIQNDADARASHTVVSGTPGYPDSKFSSIALKKGASFTIAPLAPGTYSYFDGLHMSFTGTFAVSGPAASASPSPSPTKSK